jgi:heavy metal sensor kinase
MTLTNRLSVLFLTTLALVLVGFSGSLYVLARGYLYRQADERLEAALNTLTAAAEISADGVEWEPAERQVRLGSTAAEGPLIWLVSDPNGQAVDRSVPPEAADFLDEAGGRLRGTQETAGRLDWQGKDWLFRQQWVRPADGSPRVPPDNADRRYPHLVVLVATPLAPVQAALARLAWALAGLSLGVWLIALLVGRAVCRRALLPVSRMATSARDMDAAHLGRRLPSAPTGDELEELSRAFNGLLDRLQESFERQRRFTGDASHQLRTPLAAMLGQVEVALRRERPNEEYQRVLASVKEQAERLRDIVEALLFLARADADARLPDREPIELGNWLAMHVRSWADHPRAGDLVVDTDGLGPAFVAAQRVLLGELVNILLDNACKYSAPGRPIRLKLRRSAGSIELSVEDEGPGIPREDLPHLFRPFFRSFLARERGVEGLGLGLAIARRLASALGGSLTAASDVGRGSYFTLRLPENEASASERAAAAISSPLPEERAPSHSPLSSKAQSP